ISRQLPGILYQAMGCKVVLYAGIVNVFLVSDRLYAYCQEISHSSIIDFAALLGTLSHPTLFVREPSGPFVTNGCRAPIRGGAMACSSPRPLLGLVVQA